MSPENKEKYRKAIRIALVVFIAVIVANIVSGNLGHSDSFNNNTQENIITVTGHGEVQAVPDIANVSFTIRQEAKTVKAAQEAVTQIEKKALDLLKVNNIAEKDYKTENVSFNPKYDYQYSADGACGSLTCPPRPGKQIISGYEAYESINVKVRNTDSVGTVISGLGAIGVTELSGPNFTVDKQDDLKATARNMAINDAKGKAKELAKELGVHLGGITSYSDNGNYPTPMYANDMMAKSAGALSSATPAVLPLGENLISSDVTITYKIR